VRGYVDALKDYSPLSRRQAPWWLTTMTAIGTERQKLISALMSAIES